MRNVDSLEDVGEESLFVPILEYYTILTEIRTIANYSVVFSSSSISIVEATLLHRAEVCLL